MFPVNDSNWITYIQNALAGNVAPCWVDIVGNATDPAAYYYLDPIANPAPTSVAFRMRLNGDPLSFNPNVYQLKDFVWGVQIRGAGNSLLFDVRLNASGANYVLQVLNSVGTIVHSEPIDLTSPEAPSNNTRVRSAGDVFPCGNQIEHDPDYFLDFTLLTSYFTGFNFASSTYKLCYYTSTQDNVINKENVCGQILNPPIGEPVLNVSKSIVQGPNAVCTDDTGNWNLLVTITNQGTVAANNVHVVDNLTTDITLLAPPIVAVSLGTVSLVYPVITWDIATLNPGQSAFLMIDLQGYFATPGHKVLDSGNVTATGIARIPFADPGILVYDTNHFAIDKSIISGPTTIDVCTVSTWTVRIRVTNSGRTDITNVVVSDILSPFLVLEAPPVLNPSLGSAVFALNEIIWNIDVLPAMSSAYLDITLTGFFTELGLHAVDTGEGEATCLDPVPFSDSGVTVVDSAVAKKVNVHICVLECKTEDRLNDVTAKIFDKNCKLVNTIIFDACVDILLDQGTYIVELIKEGYKRKFFVLLLGSEQEVYADVSLVKKVTYQTGGLSENKVDIFEGVILEKFDVDILFSKYLCIPSASHVECVCDVIDSVNFSVRCTSKLFISLNVEKNAVYKLNDVKQLNYKVFNERFCLPVSRICDNSRIEHKVNVENVCYFKDSTKLYNIANIKLNVFIVNYTDVILNADDTP